MVPMETFQSDSVSTQEKALTGEGQARSHMYLSFAPLSWHVPLSPPCGDQHYKDLQS